MANLSILSLWMSSGEPSRRPSHVVIWSWHHGSVCRGFRQAPEKKKKSTILKKTRKSPNRMIGDVKCFEVW